MHEVWHRGTLTLWLFAAFWFGCAVISASAATNTVTTLADSGPGSLRNTIAAAAPGDTVVFATNLSGQTITLTSGELSITANLTIDASGLAHGITLSGNGQSRVLLINSLVNAALRGLTIRNGLTTGNGGGVLNNIGILTMTGCAIIGNTSLQANGGGGGVMNNMGGLVLINCTLANNSAQYGGGLLTYNGASKLVNCTVSGNSAAQPGQGGGLWDNTIGTITLDNSIIAGNANGNRNGTAQFNVILGTNFLSGNPMLAALGGYRGPTPTMPPRLGSPVVDAGITTTNTPDTDQRGYVRPYGGGPDIGAVELQANEGLPIVSNVNDSGPGSLRDAIAFATPGETVVFAPVLSGQIITLTSGQITISQNLTLDASSLDEEVRISGNQNSRVFQINSGAHVAMTNLTIMNGRANNAGGGGIYNSGTVTLTRCTVSYNSAKDGGGIYNGGTVTLTRCTVSGNSADVYGGGIYNEIFDIVTLTSCTITGNSARDGGGIYNGIGITALICCTVSGNSARFDGAGIFNDDTMTLENSIVAGNIGAPDLYTRVGTLAQYGLNLIVGEPFLAPLGDYGGPTQTMPPLSGSPAIDAGVVTSNTPATDQRGYARVATGGLDIGAVEIQMAPEFNALGFNFVGGRSGSSAAILSPAERAGVPSLASSNWNNLRTDWSGNGVAIPAILRDVKGNPVSLQLWWDAPNTWDTGIPISSPNRKLMFGYLDSNGDTNSSTDLSQVQNQPYFGIANIPEEFTSQGYDVVVYFDTDTADQNRVGEYWLTTNHGKNPGNVSAETDLTPHLFGRDAANFDGVFIRLPANSTSDQAADTPAANYLVFPGLTSPAFYLRAQDGDFRAAINAVQIFTINNTLHLAGSLMEGQFALSVSSPDSLFGTEVEIQRSTNLVDWEFWRNLTLDISPTNVMDTNKAPMRFYRIVAP